MNVVNGYNTLILFFILPYNLSLYAETTRSRWRGISLLQLKLSLVYMTANRIQIT